MKNHEEANDIRTCDECGRITDAGEYPDWIDGKCEDCDPSVLAIDENDPIEAIHNLEAKVAELEEAARVACNMLEDDSVWENALEGREAVWDHLTTTTVGHFERVWADE